FDVQGTSVTNQRLFTDMMLDGVKCGPDGMRADVYGNLWISSNAPLGYAGVLCFTPQAKLIGRIRLPEVCANLAFGGPKRDRLFMAASTSLFVYQTTTQGAAPGGGLLPAPASGRSKASYGWRADIRTGFLRELGGFSASPRRGRARPASTPTT